MSAARAVERRRCDAGHDGHPCRRFTCAICAPTKVGDYATRISVNANALPKIVHLTTITGPGDDGLQRFAEELHEDLEHDPFDLDEGERTARAELLQILHHDGVIAAWNATASRRLSRMHRAASARCRRKHGEVPKIGQNVWENQGRDLLHAHRVLIGPHNVCQTYAEALSDLAPAYGFGYVDRGTKKRADGSYGPRQLKPITGKRAARYLGKYVSKNMRGSHGPRTVDAVQSNMRAGRRRAGGNVVYIGKLLTTKTGVTARWLRWVRVAWVFGFDPFTGEIVRQTDVLTEHLEEGIPLPRPPTDAEVERARAWAADHPVDRLRVEHQRLVLAT